MSTIINCDGEIIMLPSHEEEPTPDAVDRIVGRVKGAVALLIDGDGEWFFLVDRGRGHLEWLGVEECIPSKSRRKYPKELAEVISLRTPEGTQ